MVRGGGRALRGKIITFQSDNFLNTYHLLLKKKNKIKNRIQLKYHKRLITPKRYFTLACSPTVIQRCSLWIQSDDRNGLTEKSVLRDGGTVDGNGRVGREENSSEENRSSPTDYNMRRRRQWWRSGSSVVVGGWRRWWRTGLKLFSRRGPPARSTPNTNEIASPPPPRPDVVKTGNVARKAATARQRNRAFMWGGGGGRSAWPDAYREQPDMYFFLKLFSFYHRPYTVGIHAAVPFHAVGLWGEVSRSDDGWCRRRERERVRERRRRRLLRGPCAVRPRNPDTNV